MGRSWCSPHRSHPQPCTGTCSCLRPCDSTFTSSENHQQSGLEPLLAEVTPCWTNILNSVITKVSRLKGNGKGICAG